MHPIFLPLFQLHRSLCAFLVKHLHGVKAGILFIAHMSLFGFFFPVYRNDYASIAVNMLIFILFLSPLAVITRMPLLRILMGLRREFGILMAYLALVHGLGYIFDPSFFYAFLQPYLFSDIFSIATYILFGMAALLLMFPLVLTSNTWAQRTLGGVRWKRLHRIAYVLFIIVIVHRLGPAGFAGDSGKIAEAVITLGSYAALKYLAWKESSFPSLRRWIEGVGEAYVVFLAKKSESGA